MGSVYLAERVDDGRRVAMKLLVPELAQDERFGRRFLRESQQRPASTTRASREEGGGGACFALAVRRWRRLQ